MSTKLSDKLKVPKIGKKEIVQYEILGKRPDKLNKGRTIMTASVYVPSRDTIMDSGDDDQLKVIECIKKTVPIRNPDGTSGINNILEDIIFYAAKNGIISINPASNTDIQIYNFMERTNRNLSNPFRDQNILPLFKRLDLAGDAKRALEKAKAKRNASDMVYAMAYDELKSMAEGFTGDMTVNTNVSEDELRLAMHNLAESKPEKFVQSTAPDVNQKIIDQITQAQIKKLIELDARTWRWVGEEDKEERKIVSHKIGTDPLEVLIAHLLSDGSDAHDRIIAGIKE